MNETPLHVWKFFRAGGFDQVKLETGADLANLDQLDQKLWVALACPTRGLEFDTRTLDLIDADKDGRVRAPEVIAAAKWATSLLKNPDDLVCGASSLPLASINDGTLEGRQILASARQILINLGKAQAEAISLEDTADTSKIFAATSFNGDGIIPVDAAADDATRALIGEVLSLFGAETDRSGKPGVSQIKVEAFFAEAAAYSNWWKKAEGDANILPLGEATAAAAAAVKAVQVKVNDFFARCRLAAFDPRALAALNREEKEYLALAAKDLTITSAEIAALPLAQVAAGKALPLCEGVNPAWAAALAAFQAAAVGPLLGNQTTLCEADWNALLARFGPFDDWNAGKTGAKVEGLGLKRIREILTGSAQADIAALIARDKALEPESNAIAAVEKLIRLHRDLHTLCLNFVSFQNFYSRKTPAVFQAGRLFLDQRSCDLCLSVEDAGRHASMAGLAGAYLAYVDCVRKATGEKLSVVAVFSQGHDDNLMVGRNGIFYDRKGRDYDATITKIVSNPISLRQAFFSPYKKLVRIVEEMASKRAAQADAEVNAKLQNAAQTALSQDQKKPEPLKKMDVGVVAAIGVALGAISTVLATVFTKVVELTAAQKIMLPVVFMVAVSGPSMIIAWFKLRKRNLGPILDANGWAMNTSAKMNVPFGASLTQIAVLPQGAERDLVDPFAEKKNPLPLYALLLALIGFCALAAAWYFQCFDARLPVHLKASSILGTNSWNCAAPINSVGSLVSTNRPAAK